MALNIWLLLVVVAVAKALNMPLVVVRVDLEQQVDLY